MAAFLFSWGNNIWHLRAVLTIIWDFSPCTNLRCHKQFHRGMVRNKTRLQRLLSGTACRARWSYRLYYSPARISAGSDNTWARRIPVGSCSGKHCKCSAYQRNEEFSHYKLAAPERYSNRRNVSRTVKQASLNYQHRLIYCPKRRNL